MDTPLSYCLCKRDGADVPQRRAPQGRIVNALDQVDQILTHLRSRATVRERWRMLTRPFVLAGDSLLMWFEARRTDGSPVIRRLRWRRADDASIRSQQQTRVRSQPAPGATRKPATTL